MRWSILSMVPFLVCAACDEDEPTPADTRDDTVDDDTVDDVDVPDDVDAPDAEVDTTTDTHDADTGPLPGCCREALSDCGIGAVCTPPLSEGGWGRCEPLTAEGCWLDAQCPEGATCEGEVVCPCGAECVRADSAGTCVGPGGRCCVADASCQDDEICALPAGAAGTCKPAASLVADQCWGDDDCSGGARCFGARVCPCGALCILADAPGQCGPTTCEALDPFGFGPCDMVIGVVFDGAKCVTASGCGCGEHCDQIFPTTASCLEVCKPACVALDPQAYGVCALVLGVVFDGAGCVSASGCGCDDDCDHFFTSKQACAQACGLACVPVDPHAFGDCDAVLGVGFDGTKCVTVSGCSCGEQCDLLFPTLAACEAACP